MLPKKAGASDGAESIERQGKKTTQTYSPN